MFQVKWFVQLLSMDMEFSLPSYWMFRSYFGFILIIMNAERRYSYRVWLRGFDDGVVGGEVKNKNLRKYVDFCLKMAMLFISTKKPRRETGLQGLLINGSIWDLLTLRFLLDILVEITSRWFGMWIWVSGKRYIWRHNGVISIETILNPWE